SELEQTARTVCRKPPRGLAAGAIRFVFAAWPCPQSLQLFAAGPSVRDQASAATAATAPVPVALGPDIDMHRFGVAICADAAAARHGADIGRKLPSAYSGNLYVGGRAIHMQRVLGAAGALVMLGVAIA